MCLLVLVGPGTSALSAPTPVAPPGNDSLLAAAELRIGVERLSQHQWLLFSAALSDKGLAKSPARLPDVGTTTDRIAQTLLAVARRAWTAGRSREVAARGA